MESVTGVFRSSEQARRAATELKQSGFSQDAVSLLFPGSSEQAIHSLQVSETEQPGMGKAIGGVVGGALGMAGGFELGTVGASLLVPGVGPVLAIGIAGAALLGLGGAAGGAALGKAAESKSTDGVPADEVFFYEDALRQGHSVVVVMSNGHEEATRATETLAASGAESVDAAREAWWIGLRDAEMEQYQALGHNWERDAAEYRAGFEAALHPQARGKSFSEAELYLRREFPGIWQQPAFHHGYDRGQDYRQRCEKTTPSVTAPPPLV